MKLHVLSSSSSGNGYILQASDSQSLVLECGVPVSEVKKALNFNIGCIVGAVVTHQHCDHAQYINGYLKSAIRVCALEDVFRAQRVDTRAFCKTIEPMKGYRLGEFKVLALPVEHDVPCVGYVIEHPEMGKTLFLTDTMMFEYRIAGLSHIMIEANYDDASLEAAIEAGITPAAMRSRLLQSHMELKTTERILRTTDIDAVHNIVLLHLSSRNSNARMYRERLTRLTGRNVEIARRGLVIDMNKNPY